MPRCCLNDVKCGFQDTAQDSTGRFNVKVVEHSLRTIGQSHRLATATVGECEPAAAGHVRYEASAIPGLGPTHGGWVLHNVPLSMPHRSKLSARLSTTTQGRSSPPTAKLKTNSDTTRVLLQLDDSRLVPACNVHLSRWVTRSRSCYRFLRNVTVMYADTVVLLLRECYDSRAPGQQLTSRKRGNSPPYERYPRLSQTTSGPPAAGIMTL